MTDASASNIPASEERITLRHLKKWAKAREPFAMLTCYDATTARWLWRGGVRTMLVGDTAAEMILGHDSTLPAPLEFMLQITAAVRRGAPRVMLMADMPFGSYQCGDDKALENAGRFLTEGAADLVKLEVDETFAPLVKRMSHAGIPVVAHIGSRPQHVRAQGGYRSAGRTQKGADDLVSIAKALVRAGAVALLVEAVPAEVAERIVVAANPHKADGVIDVPVIGCGAGPACHGHVVVLHDLLGMTDWQPPFAKPHAQVGQAVEKAAADWVKLIAGGTYLRNDHPYHMQ